MSYIRKIYNKIMNNIYGSILICMVLFVVTGYLSTIITDEITIKILWSIANLGLIMGTGAVVISFVEAKYHQNPLLVIMNLLLVIIIYASVYGTIYSYDKSAFVFNSGGVIYFDFLYYSFVTFTTTGYGDIVPMSYLAKFVSASESFLFAGVISIAMLNFSNSLNKYIQNSDIKH